MTMQEVLEPAKRWAEEGARSGVATLVRVRRSAPRAPGARFAVSEQGDLAGSVSSGCVEGDLHEHIRQVLEGGEPRVVHYGITDEMAMEVGLACGGEIDVLVEPFDPGAPAYEELERVLERQGAAVLLQGLSEGHRTRAMLVRDDGERFGTLGDAELDESAAEAVAPLFEVGGTRVFELEGHGAQLFAEAHLPPPTLVIVGATPVGQALSRMASYLGFRVVVVDPREAFAEEEKFPDAERLILDWPAEAYEEIALDRYADVVVLGHDRKLDVPALAGALEAGCRYVGQIGGGRTQRVRREALLEEGFSEGDVERIHGPVGVDIGAEGPREIALAILAEVVASHHGALEG